MNEEFLVQQVFHLREFEKFFQRQIAEKFNIGRKRVRRILGGLNEAKPIANRRGPVPFCFCARENYAEGGT
jgi:DNA-binding transcriptional regulator LsrR (DeoR family)